MKQNYGERGKREGTRLNQNSIRKQSFKIFSRQPEKKLFARKTFKLDEMRTNYVERDQRIGMQ